MYRKTHSKQESCFDCHLRSSGARSEGLQGFEVNDQTLFAGTQAKEDETF